MLQDIKDSLADIRQGALTAIAETIVSQCPGQLFYYVWSALDFGIKDLGLEERLKKIELLFHLFCTDNYQTVCRYINQKETEIEPDLWDGYLLKLVHKIVLCLVVLQIIY